MQRKLPLIAVNGILDQQISPLDRGFTYGDGVFESCHMINGQIPLWSYHRDRLITSCEKLLIPLQIDRVESYLQQLIENISESDLARLVVKIIVTRGEGGRGYRLPEVMRPTICIGLFPATIHPEHYAHHGVTVRICQQRLGRNPTLSGLKHLNRLEHILARAEWRDEHIAEGLLLDANEFVIEATVSNVFIVKNQCLITPDLTYAGVAGVMRRVILEKLAPKLKLKIQISNLTLDDLYTADEIFLSNSLFGIWPVTQIIGDSLHSFSCGKITTGLQHCFAEGM